MTRSTRPLRVPPELRRGAAKGDEERQIEQGVRLLDLVRERAGLTTLAHTRILDVGCGTKLAQAIVNRGVPVGRYVGLDVYAEMIDFLQKEVTDPRLAFHHVDFHNAMYNPRGKKMSANDVLPVGDERFDLIVLFSVFTHLAPDDYHTMLRVLRKHVADGGHLIFTLFIDPLPTADFRDAVPEKPLLWAYYSEAHARALILGTGWVADELHEPTEDTQHYFVCRPV